MGTFNSSIVQDFLGRGLIFPIELSNGRAKIASGTDLIKGSLQNLFSWDYPKRFFLAEFNTRINQLLEEPNDSITQQIIKSLVSDSIRKWEPRIEYQDISFNLENPSSLSLTVYYKVIGTQKTDSFIYPFYSKITY